MQESKQKGAKRVNKNGGEIVHSTKNNQKNKIMDY